MLSTSLSKKQNPYDVYEAGPTGSSQSSLPPMALLTSFPAVLHILLQPYLTPCKILKHAKHVAQLACADISTIPDFPSYADGSSLILKVITQILLSQQNCSTHPI